MHHADGPFLPYALEPGDLARSIRGALELEVQDGDPPGVAPQRLPLWTRNQHADGALTRVAAQTTGVRVRLHTSARTIELDATFTRTSSAVHPARPFAVACATATDSRLVDVDEGDIWIEKTGGDAELVRGTRSRVRFEFPAAREADGANAGRAVTIWLPTSAACMIHSIRGDAALSPGTAEGARWIHHGSSISHGSDLVDPRVPWPQQVAIAASLDLVNLGFAGNAMLDPFVARAISAEPADLITLKIGINLVNGDAMRARTFVPAVHNFLDLVREGHPTTPLAVITALACPIHEDATGPTREASPGRAGASPRELRPGDGSLTLRRTRSLLEHVVARREDPHLSIIDGLSLLGVDDGHLPDNLHPDGGGHDLIAARFLPHAVALRDS